MVAKRRFFHVSESEVLNKSHIQVIDGELASQILDRCCAHPSLAFVGIHTRGVILMQRVLEQARHQRADIASGTIDIALYRDDFEQLPKIPVLNGSDLPFQLDDCHIVLFDDVLFTGRTTRAALDVLFDYGRPACIELAVLVDRGNRELPIAATYVGRMLETARKDYVRVEMEGVDDREGVYLRRP